MKGKDLKLHIIKIKKVIIIIIKFPKEGGGGGGGKMKKMKCMGERGVLYWKLKLLASIHSLWPQFPAGKCFLGPPLVSIATTQVKAFA